MAMPVMDGLAALKQIRENSATANIPVIVLTAMTDQKAREVLAGLRPNACLLKSSFSLQELLARIKNVLRPAA
jgi:DNA-binding response OmpR family regulator